MIAGGCAPGSAGDLPVSDLLALADCHADALGWGGYQALGQGPWFAAIMAGLLTIAIALQGYRMLAGRTPDLHHGLVGIARIGLAITLAGSASAYGTLIYRSVTQGPFEVSSRLTAAANLSGEDLPGRLDALYTAIRLDPETRGRLASGGAAAPRVAAAAVGDAGQRNAATLLVVVSAGPWVALRLTSALLLALGPLAALMLLFDATFGLFLNWLRALGAMAIALAGLAVAIPLELEALEPVIARAGTGTPDHTAVIAILGVFAVLTGAILLAAHRITGAVAARGMTLFRTGDRAAAAPALNAAATTTATATAIHAPPATSPAGSSGATAQRSHAAAVTDAVAAAARRSNPTAMMAHAPRPAGLSANGPPPAAATTSGLADGRRGLPRLRPAANRTPLR